MLQREGKREREKERKREREIDVSDKRYKSVWSKKNVNESYLHIFMLANDDAAYLHMKVKIHSIVYSLFFSFSSFKITCYNGFHEYD